VRLRTALPALALVALTAGCGSRQMPTAGPAQPSGADAAQQRAAELARYWTGSDLERDWRSGYYPLGAPTEWDLPTAFRSETDRQALLTGHLDLRVPLPDSPGTGQVRWPDGSSVAQPLVSAAQALQRLTGPDAPCPANQHCPAPGPTGYRTGERCPTHDCAGWLAVSSVTAGTRQVDTSRGRATIPVWEFTVDGYPTPFALAAVAGPMLSSPPPAEPLLPGLGFVDSWSALSADGLTLTARRAAGGCEDLAGAEVYETDQVVVLIAQASARPGGAPCTADAHAAPVTFRLSRPLGSRVVLDDATGAPLALRAAPPEPKGVPSGPPMPPGPPLPPSP
jgi:hypothetical protein